MAEIKWIKIATNMFDNRKIRQIEVLPDGDAIIVIWVKLLCLAGNLNEQGYLYFTKEVPYTEEMMSVQFNRPISTVRLALNTFEKFGMIEIIDDLIKISNWEEYQNIEGMDKIREQNKIRKRRQRERLSLEQKAECHVTSRDCHGTDIDIDKDIEKDNKYTSAFNEFWKNYPRKKDKGQAYKCYKARLNDGYSEDELLAACINYAAECEHNKTEERYIKHGATFLSVNEPFLDYLKGEKDGDKSEEQRNREIDEVIRRIESGEAEHDDDGLWD